GVLPIEAASGVERTGQPRGPRRYIMSRRGNDLVRRYLWMAALSAVQCNPAVRALYARVVAKHPQQKSVALGHAMRKLPHLGFAIWKSGRPFNPDHYPWQASAPVERSDSGMSQTGKPTDTPLSPQDPAAGHMPDGSPAWLVVTAAGTDKVAAAVPIGESR